MGKTTITEKEKAQIIYELRHEFKIKELLKIAQIKKSTYYYHISKLDEPDKYDKIKEEIKQIYHENKGRYGYRRITDELKNRGYTINHKTVQRLMKLTGVKCMVRMKKYKSYKGEVGKIAPNILKRDFKADKPKMGNRCNRICIMRSEDISVADKDELRAEIVEDIFSACFWSVPVGRICQRLNAMSCVTPDGYDEWTPELIEMIIHNEIYAGYKFIEEDGKVILYKHEFPAITKVMHAAVQKIGLTKNDAPQEERINKVKNILVKVIAQRGSELAWFFNK